MVTELELVYEHREEKFPKKTTFGRRRDVQQNEIVLFKMRVNTFDHVIKYLKSVCEPFSRTKLSNASTYCYIIKVSAQLNWRIRRIKAAMF